MTFGFDWSLFALGLIAGAAGAVLFFAGLALGMRLALSTPRPLAALLASGAIRIALLLAAGWWIAGQGVAALAGFAAAFLSVRLVLLAVLRPKAPERPAQWN